MPSTYAHYRMGQEVIKQVSAPAHDIIMKHYVERKPRAIRNSFKRLGVTLKNVRNEKKIFLFLMAFFFYIDGVYTIIDMATAYGTALGFDSTKLLLALLVTQIVAFPFAIIFAS